MSGLISLDELQTLYDNATKTHKKKAEPVTRLTLNIDSDVKQLHMLRKILTESVTSIDSWVDYIDYCSKYKKSSDNVAMLKLLQGSIMKFVDIKGKRDNQKVIDMMLLMVELQRYVPLLLISFHH